MRSKETYRIIFMGTPYFALSSLQALFNNGYHIVAVITSVDKYGGRGRKKLQESPIKQFAIKNNIDVLQPKNLKSPSFIKKLRTYKADLQVVVAFRMLPEVVWNMPLDGTINLHASLLPKYRGAAPINWAIINGEKETGVTTFKLKHAIDTGDMILQRSIPISSNDSAGTIHDKLMAIGSEVVIDTVDLIINDKVVFKKQDDTKLSKAPKIYREDCLINFNQDFLSVSNFIKGLSPYPGAWTTINNHELKILESRHYSEVHNIEPGSIATDNKNYLKIYTLGGYIAIIVLKPQGKKTMKIEEYLNGNKINFTRQS